MGKIDLFAVDIQDLKQRQAFANESLIHSSTPYYFKVTQQQMFFFLYRR